MTFKLKTLALLCLCQTAHAAYVYEQDLVPRRLDIMLDYSYTPSLNGFLQVPAGGEPGTTSEKRPTFDEVGIHDANFNHLDLVYHWNPLFMYVGYEYLRPSGSGTLTQDLVTHGNFIPAGATMSVDTQLDFFKIGLGYDFLYLLDQLRFSTALEEDFWRFDYQFSTTCPPLGPFAPGNAHVNAPFCTPISDGRSFTQASPRIVTGVHYNVTRRLALGVDGAIPLPIGNLRIKDYDFRVDYKWYDSYKMAVGPYFAVGYQQIDYHDTQTEPNHIQATLNPYYTIGIKWTM
jgi:hypothetical protein